MGTKYITYWELAVLVASLMVFGVIIHFGIRTDIQPHAQFIVEVLSGARAPMPNFLYHLTLYTLALFRTDMSSLYAASVVVLSIAVTSKFTITRIVACKYYQNITRSNEEPGAIMLVFSLLMLIIFSLPTSEALNGKLYLGQIPSNVWHNPTTIFVMPFALLLFWISCEQLLRPTKNGNRLLTLFCVLNVGIKPSFFFVFAIVYPILLISRDGLTKKFLKGLVPVLIGLSLVAILYYLIFKLSVGNMFNDTSGIAIKPFSIWSHFSPNIPISLLCSLIFPIAYIVFYWRDTMHDIVFKNAALSFVVSITIFSILSETGRREFHANFFWQCVICCYILFLVVSIRFVEKIKRYGIFESKNIVISSAFLMHVIAGVFYLIRFLYAGIYF